MKRNFGIQSLFLALGEIIYVFLIALIMQNGNRIFGDANQILALAVFLLLFVLSAAISGVLIFGKPALLYLNGEIRDALKMLSYTLGWMLFFVIAFFLFLTF